MSQRSVERALGKLVTDERFRGAFFQDPVRASAGAGLDLSVSEVEALRKISAHALADLCASLDDRICRLPVDLSAEPET